MENIIPSQNYQVESLFKCNKCEREYRTKSSLTRHTHMKHEAIDIVKLKLKNENLLLKIDLYNEQIKFLKKLILIQEHTLRTHGHPTSPPMRETDENIRLPTLQLPSIE